MMKSIVSVLFIVSIAIPFSSCKSTQGKSGGALSSKDIDAVKKSAVFKYKSPIDHSGTKNKYKYENVTRDSFGKIVFVVKDNLNFYEGSKSFELYHYEQSEDNNGKKRESHYYFTGYYTGNSDTLTLNVKYKYQFVNGSASENKKEGVVVYQVQEFSEQNVRVIRDDYNSNYSIPLSSAKNYFKYD